MMASMATAMPAMMNFRKLILLGIGLWRRQPWLHGSAATRSERSSSLSCRRFGPDGDLCRHLRGFLALISPG